MNNIASLDKVLKVYEQCKAQAFKSQMDTSIHQYFQRKRNFKIHSLSNKCHANASDLIFIGLANKCMRFYITPTEHKMILLLHVDEIFADEPLVSHKR